MDPSNSFSGLHIEPHPSSLYSHHQQQHPSQNPNPDEIKLKKITQLQVAFDHSKTTDEMLKTFQAMELEFAFDEYELGLASLKVAMMLENVGEDPEKTLSFAVRAWNALDKDDKAIFPAAMALKLLGSITYNLKRFDCSLDFLNMANSVFSRMEKDGFSEIPITAMIDEVQYALANVKMAMGKREDALENLRNCLEIKDMNMKTCDRQVAVANYDLAAAYAEVLNYKEALPFCLKALKIHDNQLGHNAIEVLLDRQLLGIIYSGLGEHQKALEQNELVQTVLNNTGLSSGFLGEEIDGADAQIALGKSPPNPTNARELKTPVEILSQMSSRSQIQEAFESAKSTEEMLKVFQDMESTFDEYELGRASLRVSLMLDKEGNDPEKILSFAYRAFNTFNRYDEATLQSVIALQLMGSATYSLNQLNDSLWYLNRAKIVLAKLEEEGMGRVFMRSVLHKVQRGLANVNRAMGRGEEALGNLRKCLDIEEINFEDISKAFGDANYALALAYVDLLNHREALSFCLQALEIHKKQVGNNSEEVKLDRNLLIRIYTELLEYQKALKQNLLLQKVLKNLGLTSDLIRAEIDAADLQIWSGKYNEALDTLKPVVQKTDKESETQAQVFVTMANALYNKRKFADAKRCLKTASGILMNKKIEKTIKVGQEYIKMGMLYETMTV